MHTGTTGKQEKSLALFISDLHLARTTPQTTRAFLDFMANTATQAERLYILGDLFEYWAGDDDIDGSASDHIQDILRYQAPYNRLIVEAIRGVYNAGTAVFWVPGNRDFLTGEQFAAESGATFLPDLYDTVIGGLKIALAHGDAQCLEDPDYVRFRAMVRNPQWQQQFLAMPLENRKLTIESFRKDSRSENQAKADAVWDVTPSAIDAVFEQTGAAVFIHGHTHRPGIYEHGPHKRYVLPDWDLDGPEKRGGWLELTAGGELVSHAIRP